MAHRFALFGEGWDKEPLPRVIAAASGTLPAPSPPIYSCVPPGIQKIVRAALLRRADDRRISGAQPAAEGFESLQKFGVEVVVNFRDEPKKVAAERQIVEQLGMRYISIPWRGRDDPSDKQVAEFLSFLEVSPETKVFVHCRRGAERTGVMVAAFRMTRQGWTPSQALAEMETFGFRGFWFRHLKKYVRQLPERLPQTSIPTPAYTSRR